MPLSEDLKDKARKLVDRARHGDQNAMAMIDQISANARGGLAVAQESNQVILDYIASKNPTQQASLGADATAALNALKNPSIDTSTLIKILCFIPNVGEGLALHAACVILSKGPLWPTNRVATVQTVVPPPAIPAFQTGLATAAPQVHGEPYETAGAIIGAARRIQAVRGGSPVSFLSPNVGWEIG
jgi:hypothetical protein